MPTTPISPTHHGQLGPPPTGRREGDADQAVAAELEQHPGQDHAHRRRRLDVRVRQPGVQRHDRHLHREADEQQHEHQVLEPRRTHRLGLEPGEGLVAVHAGGEEPHFRRVVAAASARSTTADFTASRSSWPFSTSMTARPTLLERDEIERVDLRLPDGVRRRELGVDLPRSPRRPGPHHLLVHEVADVDARTGAIMATSRPTLPSERVQHELEGRVLPPAAAPQADEDVHRQQHQLVEDVEEEEVQRQERPDDAGLEQRATR